jgi:putative membrane protein
MNLLAHANWGYGPAPWWPIIPLLFWTAVAVAIVFWVRRRGGWRRGRSAEDVIAERYARGEVSEAEYRERLAVLRERAR